MPPKKPVAAKTAAKSTGVKKTTPVKGVTKKPAGPPAAKGKVSQPAAGKEKEKQKVVKPKEKVWTKEEVAARTIQTVIRRHLARKKLEKKKREKEEYEELMEKLEKEAFLVLVKKEQEQAEKEREKEEAERRRRNEENKKKKRMLEAAFDGDNDEILTILKEVEDLDNKNNIGHDVIGANLRDRHQLGMVDCEDANKNTPLSESAAGGHASTIKLLLDKGADANSRGQFERTPLYRAAYGGHLEAVEMLLQNGGDPRLYASDGCKPEQISSNPDIQQVLKEWDISQTENLLAKIEKVKEGRKEADRKKREVEMKNLETQLKEAEKEHEMKQKELNRSYCELEKRIHEHDNVQAMGSDKADITLQVIHDAELDLEMAKMAAEESRDKLQKIRLQIREQQNQGLAGGTEHVGVACNIKELEEVLLRDVGGKIEADGRWPLVIDRSGRTATFLRYRDTNYLTALSPANMEPEVIRMALLGSIRYGKPLVLDMLEVDMFETVSMRFDEVQKGLMDSIMDKSIMKEEKFLSLVKESDGKEYGKNQFNLDRVKNFKFLLLTKITHPAESLVERTYPISVVVGESAF